MSKKPKKSKGLVWGKRRKTWEEGKSLSQKGWERDFIYHCDKLTDEIEKRLRAKTKVYTKDQHSQEFLKSLVSPKSL